MWNGQVECIVELRGEVGMDKGWQGWIMLGGNSLKAWREEEVGGDFFHHYHTECKLSHKTILFNFIGERRQG